ncbi:hypothetical protein KA037_00570 [Patescibacteria group bacterium]|nr:hypothetical protein [Patescibacteria group bacterium]
MGYEILQNDCCCQTTLKKQKKPNTIDPKELWRVRSLLLSVHYHRWGLRKMIYTLASLKLLVTDSVKMSVDIYDLDGESSKLLEHGTLKKNLLMCL